VVATLHPSFLAYSGFALSAVFESDIAKAFRFARGESTLQRGSVNSNPTAAEVRDCIGEILETGNGGVDIETPMPEEIPEDQRSASGILPVSVIGLSARPLTAISLYRDRFSELRPLFDLGSRGQLSGNVPNLWAFNSSFDFHNLEPLFSLSGVTEACSMTLFHLLYPDSTRKDLATMMSFYTDLPFHKYLQDIDPEYYNGADTWGCLSGSLEMMKEVRGLDAKREERFRWSRMSLEDLFFQRVMPAVKNVRPWEYLGANYDREASDTMLLQASEVLLQYDAWWAANIPDYNWASPKQLIELFEGMQVKLPLRKRVSQKVNKETGGKDKQIKFTPSVDDEALKDIIIAGGGSAEVAKLVQLLRGYKKAGDFTGLDKRVPGRVFCRAKVHGQVGGRIQTVEENMQQIPEMCPEFDPDIYDVTGMPFIEPRNTVIPDDPVNDVIISADFSQIEFWLYAWYSKCRRALEIKETGTYLYGGFYEDIWKEPFFNATGGRGKANKKKDLPPWKLLVAKSWPLGFIYGRGVPDPGDQGLPITKADARQIHTKFHRDYPEIGAFHAELERLVTRFGYLQTAFGRIRSFTNPKQQRNEYLAFPGQTSAVDVLLTNALNPLSLDLPARFGPRSRVLFTVHDSVICNVTVNRSLSKAEEAYNFVKKTLEAPIAELDYFSIPCEVKIGPSWGEGTNFEQFVKRYCDSYSR